MDPICPHLMPAYDRLAGQGHRPSRGSSPWGESGYKFLTATADSAALKEQLSLESCVVAWLNESDGEQGLKCTEHHVCLIWALPPEERGEILPTSGHPCDHIQTAIDTLAKHHDIRTVLPTPDGYDLVLELDKEPAPDDLTSLAKVLWKGGLGEYKSLFCPTHNQKVRWKVTPPTYEICEDLAVYLNACLDAGNTLLEVEDWGGMLEWNLETRVGTELVEGSPLPAHLEYIEDDMPRYPHENRLVCRRHNHSISWPLPGGR